MKIIGKDSKSDEERTPKKSKMFKKTRVTKEEKKPTTEKESTEFLIMLIKCSFSIEALYLFLVRYGAYLSESHKRHLCNFFFGDRTRVKESVHHIFCECFFLWGKFMCASCLLLVVSQKGSGAAENHEICFTNKIRLL